MRGAVDLNQYGKYGIIRVSRPHQPLFHVSAWWIFMRVLVLLVGSLNSTHRSRTS